MLTSFHQFRFLHLTKFLFYYKDFKNQFHTFAYSPTFKQQFNIGLSRPLEFHNLTGTIHFVKGLKQEKEFWLLLGQYSTEIIMG